MVRRQPVNSNIWYLQHSKTKTLGHHLILPVNVSTTLLTFKGYTWIVELVRVFLSVHICTVFSVGPDICTCVYVRALVRARTHMFIRVYRHGNPSPVSGRHESKSDMCARSGALACVIPTILARIRMSAYCDLTYARYIVGLNRFRRLYIVFVRATSLHNRHAAHEREYATAGSLLLL